MSSLDSIFGKLALTTVTTVSRIALGHATNTAIRNVISYISTQLPNKTESSEFNFLQKQLDLKIKNLKPTIDIIAKGAADGNRDLEPALEMCNDLKQEIDLFATHVDKSQEPEVIKRRLKKLLKNIEDVIPSLHLALRSIENKAGKQTVSASRLVRASSALRSKRTYVLKMYSLFTANAAAVFTWKEEFPKCRLNVEKINEWEYQLVIQEDLDDGLYHEDEEAKRLVLPMDHVQRMYHTQSGEILNIDDLKSSVLVLKFTKKTEKEQDTKVETKESAPEIIQEELSNSNWYAVGLYEDEEKSSKDSFDLILLESVIKLGLLESTEKMSHLEASDELISLYMM